MGLAILSNAGGKKVPDKALYKLAEFVLGVPSGAAVARESAEHIPWRRLSRAQRVVEQGPPLPLERYVGTYQNPAYGPFEVRLKGGQLEVVMGPKRIVAVLQPYSGNTFAMSWPGESGGSPDVTFTVPNGRPAEKMTVSDFEDVRRGEFVRVTPGR